MKMLFGVTLERQGYGMVSLMDSQAISDCTAYPIYSFWLFKQSPALTPSTDPQIPVCALQVGVVL